MVNSQGRAREYHQEPPTPTSCQLPLTTVLQDRYYHACFTDDETKFFKRLAQDLPASTQRDQAPEPRGSMAERMESLWQTGVQSPAGPTHRDLGQVNILSFSELDLSVTPLA